MLNLLAPLALAAGGELPERVRITPLTLVEGTLWSRSDAAAKEPWRPMASTSSIASRMSFSTASKFSIEIIDRSTINVSAYDGASRSILSPHHELLHLNRLRSTAEQV